MTKFLEVHGINASYGDIQILRDVSLKVNQGEIVALIGPNGAGKTTLMRVIAGLHQPLTGTVKLEDVVLNALPAYRTNAGDWSRADGIAKSLDAC